MFKMCKINNKGSATVETALVMGIVITVILVVIYTTFFLHDYTVTSAQMKYNLMNDKEEIVPITYMGSILNITYNDKSEKRKVVADLQYYIPLLGTRNWNLTMMDDVVDIENIRKIKVYKDGIELLN